MEEKMVTDAKTGETLIRHAFTTTSDAEAKAAELRAEGRLRTFAGQSVHAWYDVPGGTTAGDIPAMLLAKEPSGWFVYETGRRMRCP